MILTTPPTLEKTIALIQENLLKLPETDLKNRIELFSRFYHLWQDYKLTNIHPNLDLIFASDTINTKGVLKIWRHACENNLRYDTVDGNHYSIIKDNKTFNIIRKAIIS